MQELAKNAGAVPRMMCKFRQLAEFFKHGYFIRKQWVVFCVGLLGGSVLNGQIVTQVWSSIYSGPADNLDRAMAVAVDAAGNVFAAGQTNNGSSYDCYTAKYAMSDGALLWERHYNGPSNRNDILTSIAIDQSGNAIVTGYSQRYPMAGSISEYYTAKYSGSDGALLWEKRYGIGDSIAYSVALDKEGNAIVTGKSADQSFDFATIKYASADGSVLWAKRYDGPTHDYDAAHRVVVDLAGDVIVTGYTDPDSAPEDFATVKYAGADGAVLWVKRYDSGGADIANGVATDPMGDVAVVGDVSVGGKHDCYTAKYAASNGALLWEHRYNGPANLDDSGNSVAMDAAGNVIIVGTSRPAATTADAYIAKYASADGALLWEKRRAGYGFHVALDEAGNVVVAGDFFVAKYSSADGELMWDTNSQLGMSAVYPPWGKLALLPDGGAVIVGQSLSDFAVARYSPLPYFQWKLTHLGSAIAANSGDDDGDGLRTILEYATGGDPRMRDVLPMLSVNSGALTLTFSRNPAATDVSLSVQCSDDLGTWTDLARSTGGGAMVPLLEGVVVSESDIGGQHMVQVHDAISIGDPAHPRRFLRLFAAP
jgi:hypothetical protein